MSPFGRSRTPHESPDRPPVGYKIARPLLSADGARLGFRGVSLGADIVYGPVDDARCGYERRHRPPSRWCACGFYAVHDLATALELGCATEYRETVVLEVAVIGAYLRHEHGLRFERQRVRRILLPRCACGRPSEGVVDTGEGLIGWRAIAGSCAVCAAHRPLLRYDAYARLGGRGVTAACDERVAPPIRSPFAPSPLTPDPFDDSAAGTDAVVPQLAAEAALLQARLDWFQLQIDRLTGSADH
ncbi:hypothetical protein [Streptacidiphilus fuscans]|uniref:Uncharacterized protein n=1 Tax=Streptacidiphilus fuscans TaxID=2789292 RepID=A0A931B597_9ACTN|nr:hypothetical protein [Streptacidiphilus fuscans]MBF9070451.1 hypothetical protein [Streptacidiphilus fuscans]